MSKNQNYIWTPAGVVLCVDQKKEGQFCGKMYHARSAAPIKFVNMDEMIFQLEKICDLWNFPHPTTNDRTFFESTQKTNILQERTRIMSDNELLSKHGDLGTFIINVQHRQNSSWQGRLTWVEQNKTIYFRSVWELVKLVAGALDTVSEQEDKEAAWPEREEESK